ncbi:MAG: COG3650 family protein [Paracoccus sp. (in: a-proteobacteria)]
MKFRCALVLLPLALAACGDQAQGFRMPWDKPLDAAPEPTPEPIDPMKTPLVAPEIAPTQVPIEVEGPRTAVATAESSTLNAAAFIARGNEPFWRIDVSGSTAKYQTPENQSGSNVSVNRIVYRQGVEYIGTFGGSPFSLNIRSTTCTDTMSGEKFPMTAQLKIGSKRMQGCASPTSTQAPAASAQAPADKPNQG